MLKWKKSFLSVILQLLTFCCSIGIIIPFFKQFQPSSLEKTQESIDVDVSGLEKGMSKIVHWQGQLVVIRNRTDEEVALAQHAPLSALKDKLARNPNISAGTFATDLARSAGEGKENWLIVVKKCTHLGCIPIPIGQAGAFKGWFCPCHGSSYDTAGRIRQGPADYNLVIPPYRFLSENKLRIG